MRGGANSSTVTPPGAAPAGTKLGEHGKGHGRYPGVKFGWDVPSPRQPPPSTDRLVSAEQSNAPGGRPFWMPPAGEDSS